MHSCVYVYVYAVCANVCRSDHVCTCVWRPEKAVTCPALSLSTWTRFLTKEARLMNSKPQSWNFRSIQLYLAFYISATVWMYVLMLHSKYPYLLSHINSSITVFNLDQHYCFSQVGEEILNFFQKSMSILGIWKIPCASAAFLTIPQLFIILLYIKILLIHNIFFSEFPSTVIHLNSSGNAEFFRMWLT